ncbi:gliding motility-associated C-terminal domain-containing protein [Halosquirtibacter laminarini]|uniref:Gliding motility-associated C-terminal domain-containing protein n=1 Tax=Halosquirtibacter laminarini TaxID=3374600 RepID=A0AC61NMV4_9BACT|nr:gliding motility-associated C-terminal domain-containing protein [Prolixibacteraceae bacterium]
MKKFSFSLVLFFMCYLNGFSQLQSSNSIGMQSTSYTHSTRVDNIYFFDNKNASFSCSYPDATSYKWSLMDSNTGLFNLVFSGNSSPSTTTLDINGLYMVEAFNGGDVVSKSYFWSFSVPATLGSKIVDSDCDSFRLVSLFEGEKDLVYYDPETLDKITLTCKQTYKWNLGAKLISSQPYATVYDLPFYESEYTLAYTDDFGRSLSSRVTYAPVKPVVKFSISTNQDGESAFMAPLKVSFVNECDQDDGKYEWNLYKSDEVLKKETLNNMTETYDSTLYRSTIDSPNYTYQSPGEYMVQLVGYKTNPEGLVCSSTYRLDPKLKIEVSSLKVPEAFSPNGDGLNDLLLIEAKSLKNVTLEIFNRWGKKVYSASISNMAFEDYYVFKWDGTYNGKQLNTGVFFYTIKSQGRDDVAYTQKGTIHLFNN